MGFYQMKRYVLCVAETMDNEIVVLKKSKPSWQAGLLNFPGGKVEDNDATLSAAAQREFDEETGINWENWIYRGRFQRKDDFVVDVFYAKDDIFKGVKTTTEEVVYLLNRDWIYQNQERFMENFVWQLHLASDLKIQNFNIVYNEDF